MPLLLIVLGYERLHNGTTYFYQVGSNMLLLDTNSGDVRWKTNIVARIGMSETLVLSSFINRPGSLILKDELLDIGWPDKFVTPNSLAVAIKNIRKILAAISCDDLFIETVHRKGYIFHCDGVLCECSQGSYDIEVDLQPNIYIDEGLNVNDDSHHILDKGMGILPFTSVIKVVSYIIFFCFFVTSVMIYKSKANISCYNIKNARVCGLFMLDKKSKNIIQEQVGNRDGEFIYGYEKKLSDIKIYKID